MILFLGTSLVAVRTNRFLYVALFLVVTHILYGLLLTSTHIGIGPAFMIGFIVDLIAGTFFYLYTKPYLARKPEDQAQRIRTKLTKWLSGLLCLALVIAVGIVYSASRSAKETIAATKVKPSPQYVEDAKLPPFSHTLETTGFGPTLDPMLWNLQSGKPTSINQ